MIFFLLKILDLFKPLYVWQGIDYTQLRAIVGIKLEMDNRRASSFNHRAGNTEAQAAFVWMIFVYGIFGALISLALVFIPSIIFAFTMYHAYLMVMITMTLVSDFSAVLLDTSDNTIVLPRPITPRTFYAARTTHILLYIGLIGLALSAVPMIVTFFFHGISIGLSFIITTLLTIVFSVALTNGLYLLLMRFTSEERLKNLINVFQIVMTISVMGGYQILPRIFGASFFENVSPELQWWSVFIPPMWMATFNQYMHDFAFSPLVILNISLAILSPLFVWKLINQYLAPYFTEKLADLGISSEAAKNKPKIIKEAESKFSLNRWLTKKGFERAAFVLVTDILSRDRKLKLRIYPTIGTFVILIFVFFFRLEGKHSFAETIQKLSVSNAHLMAIYFCTLIAITASFEIYYSDDYKSAWVFQSAPISKPGEIILGTIKAILWRFYVPLYAATSIFVLSVWGSRVIGDLLLGLLMSILISLLLNLIGDKYLPMSLPLTARNQGGSAARSIVAIIFLAIMGGLHYLLIQIDYVILLAFPVVGAAVYFTLQKLLRLQWDEIDV